MGQSSALCSVSDKLTLLNWLLFSTQLSWVLLLLRLTKMVWINNGLLTGSSMVPSPLLINSLESFYHSSHSTTSSRWASWSGACTQPLTELPLSTIPMSFHSTWSGKVRSTRSKKELKKNWRKLRLEPENSSMTRKDNELLDHSWWVNERQKFKMR